MFAPADNCRANGKQQERRDAGLEMLFSLTFRLPQSSMFLAVSVDRADIYPAALPISHWATTDSDRQNLWHTDPWQHPIRSLPVSDSALYFSSFSSCPLQSPFYQLGYWIAMLESINVHGSSHTVRGWPLRDFSAVNTPATRPTARN